MKFENPPLPGRDQSVRSPGRAWSAWWTVLVKELVDGLRDRRTLLRVLLPSLLLGPLLLWTMSAFVASIERSAEQREIYVMGLEHSPSLRNFLERQNLVAVAPPVDFEARMKAGAHAHAVVRVPAGFEAALQARSRPQIEVIFDSTHSRSLHGTTLNQLRTFSRERASLDLALLGVSDGVFQPLQIDETDQASAQSRTARISQMIPLFMIMALLTGCMIVALDCTAGERERGSLEPLLLNPVGALQLVLGKWLAVVLLGMAVALACALGFLPAQALIGNEALASALRFAPGDALLFVGLQLPLAMGMGAWFMAVAVRSRSHREAQAGTALLMTAVSLAPMFSMLMSNTESAWVFWVPGLGQNALMLRALRGDDLDWWRVLPSVLSGVGLAILGLAALARGMRHAVSR